MYSMIENKHQYQLTKSAVESFRAALTALGPDHAKRAAIQSLIDDLLEQIREYEAVARDHV